LIFLNLLLPAAPFEKTLFILLLLLFASQVGPLWSLKSSR
jgi:hypothetical protein